MPPKSAETLQRMADAQRGKRHTAEHRANIARAGLGRHPTEDTRAKLRAAKAGWRPTAEVIAKGVAMRSGKPLSKEHREKITLGLKRFYATESLG